MPSMTDGHAMLVVREEDVAYMSSLGWTATDQPETDAETEPKRVRGKARPTLKGAQTNGPGTP